MEQGEGYVMKGETVREITYNGDRMSADGGCEVAVIAGTRCGWVMLR